MPVLVQYSIRAFSESDSTFLMLLKQQKTRKSLTALYWIDFDILIKINI